MFGLIKFLIKYILPIAIIALVVYYVFVSKSGGNTTAMISASNLIH